MATTSTDSQSSKKSKNVKQPIFFYKETEYLYGCLCQWYPSDFSLPHTHFSYLIIETKNDDDGQQTDDAATATATATPSSPTTTTTARLDQIAAKLGTTLNFNTAEQYMMLAKAILFNDMSTAAAIMRTKDPRKQKGLGRKVSDFDDAHWSLVRCDVVRRASVAKFAQNQELCDVLLATGDKELVEASPRDRVWGIGFAAKEARTMPRQRWGLNLLGRALVEAREELRSRLEEGLS